MGWYYGRRIGHATLRCALIHPVYTTPKIKQQKHKNESNNYKCNLFCVGFYLIKLNCGLAQRRKNNT